MTMNFSQYVEKLQKNVSELKEPWGELLGTLSDVHFTNINDVISFALTINAFEGYVDEISKCAEILPGFEDLIPHYCSTEEIGEVIFDGTLSAALTLKCLKESLDGALMSDECEEWVLFMINETRSTLFAIMMDSQKLIMGE